MKWFSTTILFFLFATCVASAQLYFPPNVGTTWEKVSNAELGWCAERVDSLTKLLSDSHTKGFIILKDGKIAYEQYFGDFLQTDNWYWASAGKSLTSVLIGIANQEGRLQLSDKSSKYLGEGFTSLTSEQEAKITVLHQLTMTSGLDDASGDPHCTLPECLKYKADPGSRWAYHTAPYTLLDGVISASTGMPINTYLATRVKSVTGMDGGYVKVDYNNIMVSTVRSAARFGLLMLNGGKWNETEVLSDKEYFRNSTTTSQNLNKSYGYLWWLNGKPSFMLPTLQFVFDGSLSPDAPADMYSALGKNDQIIDIIPSLNMVVVRFGDPASADGRELGVTFINEIWKQINALNCATSVAEIERLHKCNIQLSADHTSLTLQCSAINRNAFIDVINTRGEVVSTGGGVVSSSGDGVNKSSDVGQLGSVHAEVSVSGFASGVYLLRVRGSEQHVHKFVK